MIAALKWVQQNIESFGGDPNQVTIAGESGGGWAICGLVVSPLANGLFQRSIQMSGSCIKSLGRFRSVSEVKKLTKEFAEVNNASTVEELRSLDMQAIVDAGYGGMKGNPMPGVDGYVFPMHPLDLLKSGHVNGESVMIGTVFRESFTAEPWNFGFVPESAEALTDFWTTLYHDSTVKKISSVYDVNDIKGKVWKYSSIFDDDRAAVLVSTQLQTDCMFRCGSIMQMDLITQNPITKDIPVYFYQYGYDKEQWDQVSHGQDVIQIFGREMPADHPMTNNYTVFSHDFVKTTQNFFGAYIRGEGVLDDDSVQNGKYIHVVGKVEAVDLSDL